MRQIVIPARGGSKGLPRKNVAMFQGEPLITRCIRTCWRAKVDRVIVTTDDLEIAALASRAEALVVARPPELAQGTSHVNEAIAHAIRALPCDELAICQCTSPFLHEDDIDNCFAALAPEVDLAIACHVFHGLILDDVGPINYHPGMSPNRQQRKSQWQVAGHCWAMRPAYLTKPWMSGRIVPVECRFKLQADIDTAFDLKVWSHLVVWGSDSAQA